jgi:hypothetical protein
MEDQPIQPLMERNPVTQARHRREVFWQVTVPAVVVASIVFVLSVLATQLSFMEASTWADISLIWMIIPSMMMALLCTVFLGAMGYAIYYLVRMLPYYSYQAQDRVWLLNIRAGTVSNRLVAPFVRMKVFWAGLRGFGGAVGRRIPRRSSPKN